MIRMRSSGHKDCLRDPPDGHRAPEEFEASDLLINIFHILLLLVSTEVFFPGFLLTVLKSFLSLPTVSDAISYVSDNTLILGVFSFALVMIGVHEAIHYVGSRYRGLEPQLIFKFRKGLLPYLPEPAVGILITDQLITRNDNIQILLAPFIFIDTIALIGLSTELFISVNGLKWIVYFSKITLILNTAASAGDVYNAIKVYLREKGTVFLNHLSEGAITTFYYPPE